MNRRHFRWWPSTSPRAREIWQPSNLRKAVAKSLGGFAMVVTYTSAQDLGAAFVDQTPRDLTATYTGAKAPRDMATACARSAPRFHVARKVREIQQPNDRGQDPKEPARSERFASRSSTTRSAKRASELKAGRPSRTTSGRSQEICQPALRETPGDLPATNSDKKHDISAA